MTTRVSFDIATDDEELLAAIAELKGDAVSTWRLAVFCCQQRLERALQAQAVAAMYARRAESRRRSKQMLDHPGEFIAGDGADA